MWTHTPSYQDHRQHLELGNPTSMSNLATVWRKKEEITSQICANRNCGYKITSFPQNLCTTVLLPVLAGTSSPRTRSFALPARYVRIWCLSPTALEETERQRAIAGASGARRPNTRRQPRPTSTSSSLRAPEQPPAAWTLSITQFLDSDPLIDTCRAALRTETHSCTLIARVTAPHYGPDGASILHHQAKVFQHLEALQGSRVVNFYGLWRGEAFVAPAPGYAPLPRFIDVLLTEDLGDDNVGQIVDNEPAAVGQYLSLTPSSMPVPCPANGIPDLYCIATRPGSSAAEVDASPPAPTLCFTCFSDVILADDQHFDMWAMLERQWVDGCIDMCLPQAAVPDAS
ncbi:unnamed protein product [Cutaneotrichosporon oleaginosum]